MPVYVILCHFMSIYASLCHIMSVYVNLCQFVSLHVTYISWCQLTSVCQFVTSCQFVSFFCTPLSLRTPPPQQAQLPFLLRSAYRNTTVYPSGLSIILTFKVLFSVCCFVTTVMLVPLDHNIFCVSVCQITIKNTKHISINNVVRCVRFHVLESCQCTH